MQKLLRKYKLIDSLTFEIEANKNEFIEKLKNQVDPDKGGLFSKMFEAFSSSDKTLKGTVGHNSFKVRRKQRMFDNTAMLAKAEGKFRQEREQLVFDVEINGVTTFMKVGFFFLLVIYSVMLITFLSVSLQDNMSFFVIPFICLHGLLMLGIPIFMIRKSVKNLKREIEKEFFYIAKR